jgi:hypothetical protein
MLQPTELMVVIYLCLTVLQAKEFGDGIGMQSSTILSHT